MVRVFHCNLRPPRVKLRQRCQGWKSLTLYRQLTLYVLYSAAVFIVFWAPSSLPCAVAASVASFFPSGICQFRVRFSACAPSRCVLCAAIVALHNNLVMLSVFVHCDSFFVCEAVLILLLIWWGCWCSREGWCWFVRWFWWERVVITFFRGVPFRCQVCCVCGGSLGVFRPWSIILLRPAHFEWRHK